MFCGVVPRVTLTKEGTAENIRTLGLHRDLGIHSCIDFNTAGKGFGDGADFGYL